MEVTAQYLDRYEVRIAAELIRSVCDGRWTTEARMKACRHRSSFWLPLPRARPTTRLSEIKETQTARRRSNGARQRRKGSSAGQAGFVPH